MICKLDDGNYDAWKTQMRLFLRNQELWEIVNGSDPPSDYASDDDKKKWKKNDLKVHTFLVGSLTQDKVISVQHCESSNEVWTNLESSLNRASAANRDYPMAKFYEYNTKPSQKLADAYKEQFQMANSLRAGGFNMDDSQIIAKIVSSLPNTQKYIPLRESWKSVHNDERTLVNLERRFKEFDLDNRPERDGKDDGAPPKAYRASGKFQKGQRKGKGRETPDEIKKRTVPQVLYERALEGRMSSERHWRGKEVREEAW